MSNPALVEFYGDAAVAVAALAGKVSRLAALFREGNLKAGNEGLSSLSNELHDFVVMIGVMQGPLAVDPARLIVDGVGPDEQIGRLGSWLETLVTAQGERDWLTIADLLEYELEPVLRGWESVLQQCAAR